MSVLLLVLELSFVPAGTDSSHDLMVTLLAPSTSRIVAVVEDRAISLSITTIAPLPAQIWALRGSMLVSVPARTDPQNR
jgi:hypothetical protein